jgi:hypothetical protein
MTFFIYLIIYHREIVKLDNFMTLSLSYANTALQRQNAKNLKQIFPEKEYRGSTFSAGGNMWTDPGIYKSLTDT